jgi:hypothetical protein
MVGESMFVSLLSSFFHMIRCAGSLPPSRNIINVCTSDMPICLIAQPLTDDIPSAILVDSTRRGKHLPDALSKTVPIWCAVLNSLLFPDVSFAEYHRICRLPEVISDSEHAQMEASLSDWVESARVSLQASISSL